jgi:hypothetical protein
VIILLLLVVVRRRVRVMMNGVVEMRTRRMLEGRRKRVRVRTGLSEERRYLSLLSAFAAIDYLCTMIF